jgi:hypothetical protein
MKFFSFLCGVIFGLWMFWVTVKVWNIPFQKSRPIDSTTTTSEWMERKWMPLDSCAPSSPTIFQFQNDDGPDTIQVTIYRAYPITHNGESLAPIERRGYNWALIQLPKDSCIGAAGNSKENPNRSEQGLRFPPRQCNYLAPQFPGHGHFRGLDSVVYAIEFSK